MREFPKSVYAAARRVATKHPDDIDKAVGKMVGLVLKLLDSDDDFREAVARSISRELIWDVRLAVNQQIKQETGIYGGPAKVVVGKSKAVQRAAKSVYDLFIDGNVLGDVLGEDLKELSDQQFAKRDGHGVNGEIYLRLSKVVPAGKRVRDVVTERRLRAICSAAQKTVSGKSKVEPRRPR